MTKFKPFLFGLLSGAGIVFLALQYHVVHSQDGFRFVPRTPQHSVGLAYVDIRNWTAEDWADRSEVARACIACGMSDLVSQSVADELVNAVSSDSPIDQLRGYLNETEGKSDERDSLFDGFLPLETSHNSLKKPLNDLLSSSSDSAERDTVAHRERGYSDSGLRARPRDTGAAGDDSRSARSSNDRLSDPFAVEKRPATDYSAGNRYGSNDSARSGEGESFGFSEVPANTRRPRYNETVPRHTVPAKKELSPEEETDLLEQMIWGREPATKSSTSSSGNMGFEDVTSALENRASEALERARAGLRNESDRAMKDSSDAISRALQKKVRSSVPDSVREFLDNGPAFSEPAESSSSGSSFGFDPFAD